MVEGDVLKQDQLALPDFLWLLRDVDTMPTGVDAISPTDYVKQILKKNKSYGVSSILEFFPSFNCLTIPPPSAAAAVLAEITSNLDNLSVHFNRGVDAAVEHMLNTIRVKVGYGSSIKCDGSLLACLIEQYFTLINKPDSVIPTFQSSWLMAMEVKLRRVAESLVCEYDRDMRGELAGKLPMKEGRDGETGVTLMNIHLQVFAKRRLEYQDAIISFLSESHRTSAKLSDFESGLIAGFDRSIAGCDANMLRSNVNISGPLLNFVQENSRLSDEICTSLYNQKYIKLVNVKLQNAFSTQVPATIDEELGMLSAEYYEEARGPAVESVYKRLRAESSKLEADLLLIPGPVTNLKFAGIASDRVKLRWECPDFNPQAAEKYIVCIRTKGKSWMVVAIRRLCSVLIRGLKTRKRYNFAVLASNKKYTGMKFRHCSVETKISGKATIALTITTAILAPAGIVYLGGVIGIGVVAGALVAIQSYSKTIGDTTSVGCEEVDYLGESSAADSDEVALEDFEAHDYFAEVESEQLQDLVESEDEHV